LKHSTPAVLAVPLGLGTAVFERFKPSFWLRVGQAVTVDMKEMMKAVSDVAKNILARVSATYRWPNVQVFRTI